MNSEEGIDAHIAKLIEGKGQVCALAALKNDLGIKNPDLVSRWDEIYSSFPSCKHLTGTEYQSTLMKKYIRTYKACLEEAEKLQSER